MNGKPSLMLPSISNFLIRASLSKKYKKERKEKSGSDERITTLSLLTADKRQFGAAFYV